MPYRDREYLDIEVLNIKEAAQINQRTLNRCNCSGEEVEGVKKHDKSCHARFVTPFVGALDYWTAMIKNTDGKHETGKQIDSGREPYIADRLEIMSGMDGFIAVYDVMRNLHEDGDVIVDTHNGAVKLSIDAAIFWR